MAGNSGQGENYELSAEALIHQHGSAVLGFCLAHTRTIHDAEDAMQETLMKGVAGLNALRDPGRARAWLIQIARNVCIDRFRRPSIDPLPDQVEATASARDPRIEALHRAILRLPVEYREAVSIYYLDGRNGADVARALGISQAAVRQRLVRARLMLHDLLKEEEP